MGSKVTLFKAVLDRGITLEIIMFIVRGLDSGIVTISVCILHLTLCQGRPLRKRTVSEVQLMHNVGVHKHVQERQDWLQMRLRDIHATSARNTERTGDSVRPTRRLPKDLHLSDLTSDEIEFALNYLETVLSSRQIH